MSKSFAGEPPRKKHRRTRSPRGAWWTLLWSRYSALPWVSFSGFGLPARCCQCPHRGIPSAGSLYGGGWLIAGVLGALVIRKPGAALYCELIAATVEGLLGTHFGFTVLLSGLVQGLGAELGFAAFRYRKFNLPVALLAGALAGLAMGINDSIVWNVAWAFEWKAVYVLLAMISGAVIAGLVSWLAVRGLARTGALASLPSRGAATERAV